ncbi:hypothetical protein AUJ95_04370 [Candidatus Desantisbacteria bacterium CG2_30_40_21]|uniref:Uncharacterized protein n=5 Tax=unclassified Candidatus Desantisiibacteriota TaxID=3106372 RepID=A0A2M7J9A0_9BACT|nr:MAG: hypothetical protein AUJ95_04370 [Candidatus Desantisbacteria bacterium CG2_30_40_21]PIP39432.1 MAG: hypothetical protein COX18_10150 [Candidatus Desantisbacteria bacterium CG23_combo_of_CG06-09_8_20_14_all_40_23]PIX15990.1 MAG: hypothetical protein COZ71_08855 [Candidatus Desantisbacteria bacterium CG_4_8_14_3_um_filter_40_12]PIY19473.1 MAG: hypothetical protein COZ13_05195 [Candidatus Desantisbacteria bacterium CG_4_10_14_3_um_filter_40_18]PJB29211.1 MAG: hypothetical protein CO110_07
MFLHNLQLSPMYLEIILDARQRKGYNIIKAYGYFLNFLPWEEDRATLESDPSDYKATYWICMPLKVICLSEEKVKQYISMCG